MRKVFVSHTNIISALGFDSKTVVDNIAQKISGLTRIENTSVLPEPFYASLVADEVLNTAFEKIAPLKDYTKLEKMMLLSLSNIINNSGFPITDRVGLIVSTTKGNIEALEPDSLFPQERAYLSSLGEVIKDFFSFTTKPIVVSNACVSGILSLAVAKRYIEQNQFDHVFVVSGDLVSNFILSGFNSFQALSDKPCQPYSKDRSGINIGEVAASTLVTSSTKNLSSAAVQILGESSCNDANHISGPSRTGEGLYRSIAIAMRQAQVLPQEIDYISAHGTATVFNDEMESIAFNRLHLSNVPLNSFKGYFGHTLGASGLLETIIGMHSLERNELYASLGYEALGTSKPLNVITETTQKSLHTFLKTASGFGGCNTAIIFKKVVSDVS